MRERLILCRQARDHCAFCQSGKTAAGLAEQENAPWCAPWVNLRPCRVKPHLWESDPSDGRQNSRFSWVLPSTKQPV